MNFSHFLIKSKNSKQGFTLIELLVVVAISSVILGAIIIQQSKWNDQLWVNTQTYELALMIRQAQVYSLGVREYSAGSGDKFNIGYGINFNQNNLGQYIFFADINKDFKYNAGDAIIETRILANGVTISSVCGNNGSDCMPGSGPLREVNVTFFRPETKANMTFLKNGGNQLSSPPATIFLRSPQSKISSIKVEANGQVSIIP